MTAKPARSLRPTFGELGDAAFALALVLVGLVGFRTSLGGSPYLRVGVVGAVGGILVAFAAARLRSTPLVTLLASIAAFTLLGGGATPADAVAGVLPGPEVPAGLVYGLVHGWRDLLTTAPPVGIGGGIGVVPYVLSFVGALVAGLLSWRTRAVLLPVAPALVVVLASAVFGTQVPASLAVQGGLFAALALLWCSRRADRERPSIESGVHWPNLVARVAMVGVVGLVALEAAPHLPVGGRDRLVARDRLVPPFDPRSYPSPLGAFRSFRTEEGLESVLFTIEGGSGPVRLATMDSYDGVVWTVGGAEASASGRFIRVGSAILPVPAGAARSLEVTAVGYRGVWMPTVGVTRAVTFTGARAEQLAEGWRYNRATGMAASPIGVEPGDGYRVDLRVVPEPERRTLVGASVDASVALPEIQRVPGKMTELAAEVTEGAGSSFEQAVLLEEWFQSGWYSDGDVDPGSIKASAPGHSLARIASFIDEARPTGGYSNLIGNAEQYAATMALFARSLGLPARVVLGFQPPAGGGAVEVTGADVDAWVEVAFEGAGWVSFHPTPPKDREPEPLPDSVQRRVLAQQDPPPALALDPPDDASQSLGRSSNGREDPDDEEEPTAGGSSLRPLLVGVVGVASPLLLASLVLLAIVGFKRRRRRRRRTGGTAAQQIAGAWSEVLDRARDAGIVLPANATRREIAAGAPADRWIDASGYAAAVDAAVFGAVEPGPAGADHLWAEADAQIATIRAPLGLTGRWRSAISLRSIRSR